MSKIDVECPACGLIGKVDEAHVGKTITCNSCGKKFEVEVGDTYGLAGDPPARPASAAARTVREADNEPEPDDEEAAKPEPPKSWLEAWPTD